jgi:cytoskeletal protein CcmA (bactofilin family)
MKDNNLQDLRISGAGSTSGGTYRDVRISGAGHVKGSIECETMKTSGASDVSGDVVCREITVSGKSEIKGNVKAESMNTSGASKVMGNAEVAKMSVTGATEIGGNFHGEKIDIKGSLNIGGDCEAESFKSDGVFQIGGLLNADNIEIKVHGKCKATEIGGETINVSIGNLFGFDFVKVVQSLFDKYGSLMAELIEGDEVTLENTIAKVVRGNNVTIGRESIIDLVEYRGTINIIDGAIVKEQRRL